MLISARTRFLIAALATAVGIALVVGYSWRALDLVTEDADRIRDAVARIGRIERVEEELHELAAQSPGADAAQLRRHVERLVEMPCPPEQRVLLEELQARVREAEAAPSPTAWARAAERLSEVGRLSVESAARSVEDTSRPAADSARDIRRLGAAVALVCGALALAAFVRLRRERREAEAQLRRSDRLAVLGTMAASVAHEINNPLATISGCATAVGDRLRRAGDGAHADEIEYLDMIVDETRRCTGIVRSLRDLARDTPPAMAPCDVAALVREVVALFRIAREGPELEVRVEGEPSLEIVCDPDKLKQLLLNLLVNARDASPDGGVVTVRVERGDHAARIQVADQGCGLSSDDLARVFEPFRTGKTRGLGLGLFVCERVAALHAGRIEAQSDGPGRGARFTVTLPLQPPGRPAPGVVAGGAA